MCNKPHVCIRTYCVRVLILIHTRPTCTRSTTHTQTRSLTLHIHTHTTDRSHPLYTHACTNTPIHAYSLNTQTCTHSLLCSLSRIHTHSSTLSLTHTHTHSHTYTHTHTLTHTHIQLAPLQQLHSQQHALFWGGHHGPHYLLHIIRVVHVLIAIDVSLVGLYFGRWSGVCMEAGVWCVVW
jgi:hypothetical protein